MTVVPTRQLPALLRLRWHMIRSPRQRATAAALLATLPGLLALAVFTAMHVRRDFVSQAGILAPTAYLAFVGICVLAPLSAGGGNELFPPDQLLAYPVRASAAYHAALLLAPLNLAWALNSVGLLGLTVYVVPPGHYTILALVTALVFIVMATLLGWAVAWIVLAARTSRVGRLVSNGVGVALVAAVAVIVATGRTAPLLDQAPTRRVVFGLLVASRGNSAPLARRLAVLILLTVVAYAVGRAAFRWAARSPSTRKTPEQGVRRRRSSQNGPLRELLKIDHASVWRSTPLRRGLVVLAVAPGVIAAAVSLPWWQIILLPGLSAAGAALLFGVNAFCLDGSGIIWLASQPQRRTTALTSKALVVAEVCLFAVVLTVGAAALRAESAPRPVELLTLGVWSVLVIVVVVAVSLDLSVSRPHRADLRGPRDTPAPPGVMAAYSMRLAFVTTMLGLFFGAVARVGTAHELIILAAPVAAIGVLSLVLTFLRWRRPDTRARVVTVVSAG